MAQSDGMHHVTAICGDAGENLDFYSRLLGLRLVKRTVNFDDPTTYHLYYGDGLGRPGTILTFFPWGQGRRGHPGSGQVTAIALAVPAQSMDFWRERLESAGISAYQAGDRFGEPVLALADPDGIRIELVGNSQADDSYAWVDGPVPVEHAVRAVHSLTLASRDPERTAELMTATLGFIEKSRDSSRLRLVANPSEPAALADLLLEPPERGSMGVGAVHHVAWRTRDDAEQAAWRATLTDLGFSVTDVRDRQYFRSIYFREPGGILFEIATDIPGFTADEPVESLGRGLKLPPWLEERRAELEAALPALNA